MKTIAFIFIKILFKNKLIVASGDKQRNFSPGEGFRTYTSG